MWLTRGGTTRLHFVSCCFYTSRCRSCFCTEASFDSRRLSVLCINHPLRQFEHVPVLYVEILFCLYTYVFMYEYSFMVCFPKM